MHPPSLKDRLYIHNRGFFRIFYIGIIKRILFFVLTSHFNYIRSSKTIYYTEKHLWMLSNVDNKIFKLLFASLILYTLVFQESVCKQQRGIFSSLLQTVMRWYQERTSITVARLKHSQIYIFRSLLRDPNSGLSMERCCSARRTPGNSILLTLIYPEIFLLFSTTAPSLTITSLI